MINKNFSIPIFKIVLMVQLLVLSALANEQIPHNIKMVTPQHQIANGHYQVPRCPNGAKNSGMNLSHLVHDSSDMLNQDLHKSLCEINTKQPSQGIHCDCENSSEGIPSVMGSFGIDWQKGTVLLWNAQVGKNICPLLPTVSTYSTNSGLMNRISDWVINSNNDRIIIESIPYLIRDYIEIGKSLSVQTNNATTYCLWQRQLAENLKLKSVLFSIIGNANYDLPSRIKILAFYRHLFGLDNQLDKLLKDDFIAMLKSGRLPKTASVAVVEAFRVLNFRVNDYLKLAGITNREHSYAGERLALPESSLAILRVLQNENYLTEEAKNNLQNLWTLIGAYDYLGRSRILDEVVNQSTEEILKNNLIDIALKIDDKNKMETSLAVLLSLKKFTQEQWDQIGRKLSDSLYQKLKPAMINPHQQQSSQSKDFHRAGRELRRLAGHLKSSGVSFNAYSREFKDILLEGTINREFPRSSFEDLENLASIKDATGEENRPVWDQFITRYADYFLIGKGKEHREKFIKLLEKLPLSTSTHKYLSNFSKS